MEIEVILAIFGVCLYSLSFIICVTMIILILIRIRPLKSNVSVLLTCNTYFNALLLSSIMLLMYSYNLEEIFIHQCHLVSMVSNAYLFYSCLFLCFLLFICSSSYFSIISNSPFIDIKILQTFSIFVLAIIIQWILSFLFILPNLLLNDFQYLSSEYNCWIHFENIRGLIMATIMIYNNPVSIIVTIYTQIIRYTRRAVDVQQRRQISNKRDIIILKRIVILAFIIVGIGLPTVAIVLVYLITKYIIPFAYHIQGLSISLGVLVGSISLVFITPQIQKVFTQNQAQVRPHETRMIEVNRHIIVHGTQIKKT